MYIYKYLDNWYIARAKIKGRTCVGFGRTHLEALSDCLTK